MKVLFGQVSQSTLFQTKQRPWMMRAWFQPAPDAVDIRFGGRVQPNLTEKQARQFVKQHSRVIEKLGLASAERGWASTCQGADYKEPGQDKTNELRETETDQAYKQYFNNPQAFQEAEALMQNKGKIADRLLVRQLKDLYEGFKDAGKSPELLALEDRLMEQSSKLVGIFNNYRGMVDGQVVSNLGIRQRIEKSDDPVETKKLWMASEGHGQMEVSSAGPTLAEALVDLVKQRNEVARQNKDEDGKPYSDYFSMKLHDVKINEDQLVQLLDQMDEATREPYQRYKQAFNQMSVQRYGISSEEANLPWYAKNGNGNLKRLLSFDMQPYLKGKDPLELLEKTANLMGNSVQDMITHSVYSKNGETRSSIYFDKAKDDGKSQHWFSFGVHPPTTCEFLEV
jgi:Peptidase family M3